MLRYHIADEGDVKVADAVDCHLSVDLKRSRRVVQNEADGKEDGKFREIVTPSRQRGDGLSRVLTRQARSTSCVVRQMMEMTEMEQTRDVRNRSSA